MVGEAIHQNAVKSVLERAEKIGRPLAREAGSWADDLMFVIHTGLSPLDNRLLHLIWGGNELKRSKYLVSVSITFSLILLLTFALPASALEVHLDRPKPRVEQNQPFLPSPFQTYEISKICV